MFLSLQTRNLSLQKIFVIEDKQNIHFLIYNNSKQSYCSIKNYFIHNHLIYIQDLIWNNIWKQKKSIESLISFYWSDVFYYFYTKKIEYYFSIKFKSNNVINIKHVFFLQLNSKFELMLIKAVIYFKIYLLQMEAVMYALKCILVILCIVF